MSRPAEARPLPERPAHPRRARPLLAATAAALLFAALTPWALRPWFTASDAFPRAQGSAALMADADLYLNVWILAWIAHAALTDPARLFDGNIFHPAPQTIVGSENMLAHLPVTVPILAATGNALAVLKAMVLESFVLSGLAMYLLVFHHTRSVGAALVAGAAYTFTPFRVRVMPEPQYLGAQYLPLALLAVDLWLGRRRVSALVGVAAAVALQALACVYIGYFTLVAVPAYAGARLVLGRHRHPWRAAAAIGIAVAVGCIAVVPAALPYLRARALGVIPAHPVANVGVYSWPPWIYLTPVIVGLGGIVPVAVVALDLAARTIRRLLGAAAGLPRVAPEGAMWVLAATGAVLSAGPWLLLPGGYALPMPYLLLYHLVPGFSAVRAPVRFFIVVLVALAALSGYAFARWTARLSPPGRVAAALVLVLGCLVGAAPRPAAVMPARLGEETPAVYRWLAVQPRGGAVLEIPGWKIEGDITGNLRNGRYMVASTVHGHPLVNGYTAYPPPSAGLLGAITSRLPAPDALAALVDSVDVRWVILHRDELVGAERTQWQQVNTPGLEFVARFGPDEVYAVTRNPERPWRAELLARSHATASTSLEGTPTAALAPVCRAAELLEVEAPPILRPTSFPAPVRVRFRNTSPCRWPGIGVRPEGLVGFTYRWTDPSGRTFPRGAFTRLIRDVAPGETVEDTVLVFPPGGEYGPWQLVVSLVQHGSEESLASDTSTVTLHRWPERR